jgi:hypothetical protein
MQKRHLLVIREGEEGRTIAESPVSAEVDLQDAFRSHPELIPVRDLELGRLLVVGRETTVASGGAVDLLAVDPRGRVVVAEFERGPENRDSHRAIAQMLEYASWLWGRSYESLDERVAQPYFHSDECTEPAVKGATSLEQAAARHWTDEDGFSPDGFRQGLARTLSEGKIDCIIISTELDRSTRRVIDFLNATARFRIYGVEVDHSIDAERQVFVPRAAVTLAKERRTGKTTRDNFLASCGEHGRTFFTKLLEFMDSSGETIYWGVQGFSFRIDVAGEKRSVLYGYPRGAGGRDVDHVYVIISELRKTRVPDAVLTDYANGISALLTTSETAAGNITFDLDEKADEAAADLLTAALGGLLGSVGGRRGGP